MYYFTKRVEYGFNDAIERVTEALSKEGFGILTQIDVTELLKKKLDVDFRPYRIFGACNPQYALKALKSEDKIGTMVPCNVVVQVNANGETEVTSIDPKESTIAVRNDTIANITTEMREKLKSVIESL